jgi:hypothetical protein
MRRLSIRRAGGAAESSARVHRLYFEPKCPDLSPRTMWSLSTAFQRVQDPVTQFKSVRQNSFFQLYAFGGKRGPNARTVRRISLVEMAELSLDDKLRHAIYGIGNI